MKILIIDDNRIDLALQFYHLRPYGLVHCINNEEKVINRLTNCLYDKYYDIIFLDIVMPTINGIALSKLIRLFETKHKLLPAKIVITTCLSIEETVKDVCRSHLDFYIVKPMTKDKLIPIIKKII